MWGTLEEHHDVGMSNPDVMKLTMSGERHPKPPLCSSKLYDTLLKCWDADPAKRPAFPQLCDAFKEMYTVCSKSADANAARVEAAANDRLKRGEAANQYTSFDDAGDAGGAVGANGSKGVNQLVDKLLDGATASNTSHHFYPQTN